MLPRGSFVRQTQTRSRDFFPITLQGFLNWRPAMGAAEQGRGRPEPPPTWQRHARRWVVTMAGYYGNLRSLWELPFRTAWEREGERLRGGEKNPQRGEGWRNRQRRWGVEINMPLGVGEGEKNGVGGRVCGGERKGWRGVWRRQSDGEV